ncbi:MAG: hypothetical protein ACXV5Q_09660, partial [Frankiaceae bacterium]
MPFWPCRSVWARWSAVDVAWAIGLCVLAQIEVVHAGLPAGSVVAAAVATLPVAVRGRAPLPATALIAAAPLLDALLGGRWTEPPTYLLALLLM